MKGVQLEGVFRLSIIIVVYGLGILLMWRNFRNKRLK
jgi:hypothetical protein